MLSGAQTTDLEDHRGPSLWDPFSREPPRSRCVPAPSCPDPQESQLFPSPPAWRYVGIGPSESCLLVMYLGPCHHPASLRGGQAGQDYDS